MDLPDVMKERLIELEDENNQLKSELKRLRERLVRNDEILNELEEENVQLRKSQEQNSLERSKCAVLEQNILSLKKALEEKNIDSGRMSEEIATLKATLNSARDEIDELRRARTPISADESLVTTSSDTIKMIRLQEERDDAVFELQSARYQINALESERNDFAERAEAAASEAQEMSRHLKELREQLQQIEAERMASCSNIGIASRGNSIFAEDKERVKLEADLKLLYSKYEAARRENYQLSNELDEARLMALRRSRSEATGRCRCQQMSAELVDLRGRVQTMDNRLATAKNDLINMAGTKSGIDPVLKSFYRSLKLEMEVLRKERNNLRDERDKLVDENATLAARASNAEKSVEFANDDLECLKLQLSLIKEREQKKDVAQVAEVNGENGDCGKGIFSAISALKFTPASTSKQMVNTPYEIVGQDKRVTKVEPFTPLDFNKKHNFLSNLSSAEKMPYEFQLKKIKLTNDQENNEEDALRRDSLSARELRRIARKQARMGQSKVLPIAEPWMRFTAKPDSTLEKCHEEGPSSLAVLDDNMKNVHTQGYHSSAVNFRSHVSLLEKFCSFKNEAREVKDCQSLPTLPSYLSDSEVEQNPSSSKFPDNVAELEAGCVSHHNPLDSSKDFSMRTLVDVPEEKENVSYCSSPQNS